MNIMFGDCIKCYNTCQTLAMSHEGIITAAPWLVGLTAWERHPHHTRRAGCTAMRTLGYLPSLQRQVPPWWMAGDTRRPDSLVNELRAPSATSRRFHTLPHSLIKAKSPAHHSLTLWKANISRDSVFLSLFCAVQKRTVFAPDRLCRILRHSR